MISSLAMDETTLPMALQRGLIAIRERILPAAVAVAVDGNFVLVYVGQMAKSSSAPVEVADSVLPENYLEDSVTLFARVSRNFPNAESYGVITVPALTRSDGKPIEWQHRNNQNAASIASILERSDIGFWSWNWTGAPQRVPEDLVAVVEWARRCIREGAI